MVRQTKPITKGCPKMNTEKINKVKDDDVSEVKKIAIDLGSANIKVAIMDGDEYKFKKIKSKVSLNAIDTNYVVSTTSNTLSFGTGESLIQQDKTKREYIEETILLATSLMFEDEGVIKIDLALGLPLDLYKSEKKREDFDIKLQGMKNKPISGNVNGRDIIIKINSILVCAEGYSGFLSLNNKVDKKSPFIIIDTGYRTTDILSIDINHEEDELVIGKFKTFNQGMLEVFEDIQKQFLNDTGNNFPAEVIENRILYSPTLKIGQETLDLKSWIKFGSQTIKEILRSLELTIPDAMSRNIYLVGGGAAIFDEIVKYLNENGSTNINTQMIGTIDESIYANVTGYYMQLNSN